MTDLRELIYKELTAARERTALLTGSVDEADLVRQHSPLMSPLVWDLAHIAAYEDLWIGHRLGGRELLRPDLAALYDAFETPRAVRGDLELLDAEAAAGRARAIGIVEGEQPRFNFRDREARDGTGEFFRENQTLRVGGSGRSELGFFV